MLTWLAGAASAHPDVDVLPERRDTPVDWAHVDHWSTSPPVAATGGGRGTRVAAWIELTSAGDGGPPLHLEARGVHAGGARGPGLTLEETFAASGVRVAVVDLDGAYPAAELAIDDADRARIQAVRWELLTPRYPDAGRQARAARAAFATPLGYELDTIGVIDRATWGARPTTCSSLEDDWYRMAIHHTAGTQTTGGTVEGAVQGLQAYSQDSGEYCDIPYQFLVGYDGSLWEGRPLTYTSGATGGGNNDGNIAVSFLGCYHPYGCPYGAGDPVTEEMIDGAQLLVQTLVEVHGIASDADAIRGHRDWPYNATACPGDWVYDRLDDLRTDLAWYAGVEVGRSDPAGAPLVLAAGEAHEVWVELENTGGLPWVPGITHLGTTDPRDVASPLADPSWPGDNRAATVDAVVPRGDVGRFTFTVTGGAPGSSVTQAFGLVQDGVSWFADAPWGGGPSDALVVLTVDTTDGSPPPGTPGTSGTLGDADEDGVDEIVPLPPSTSQPQRIAPPEAGCGCAAGPSDVSLGLALAAAIGWRRRHSPALSPSSSRATGPSAGRTRASSA